MYEKEKVIDALEGISMKEWLYLRAAVDEKFKCIAKSNTLNSEDVQDVVELEKDPVIRLSSR